MHPADELSGTKSNKLQKKKIVLGITGSIAAVETIKLARELIRHGAEVIPVMTPAASKIIHPDAIWFATGHKPIVELTGETEHVYYCGRVKDRVDLLLICPCTANTISKIAHGIDDTTVTTFATTALGSPVPILVVPAMHLSMYDHKILQENIKKCKQNGIKFVEPVISKNKAKMANVDEIVANVIRETGKKDLSKKKILIIGGSTAEPIDDVRVVANRSSGKTALHLAVDGFYRGADVEIWLGWHTVQVPDFIKYKNFETVDDLLKMCNKKILSKYDVIILCAAIADYIPKKQKGKIPSGKNKLLLEMRPSSKVVSVIRKNAPTAKIIGFKVEEKKDNLKNKAIYLLKENNLDFVVGNTISAFEKDTNEIWIYTKRGKPVYGKGKKEYLASLILDMVK